MSYHNKGGDRRKEWNNKRDRSNKQYKNTFVTDSEAGTSHGNIPGHGFSRKAHRAQQQYNPNKKVSTHPYRAKKNEVKHPPHLTGKEIGLFYRNLQLSKPKKMKVTQSISLPIKIKTDITELLSSLDLNTETESNIIGTSTHESQIVEKYKHISDSKFKTDFIRTLVNTRQDRLRNACATSAIERDRALDEYLKIELETKMENNAKYKKMQEFRMKLPSYDMRNEILDLIEKNQIVVISGETGCGKTTQVAQFILDQYIMAGKGSLCKIICTQPRRISAISVAERVADERSERCGDGSVGYQIRLERLLPRQAGSIIYCTTGVLLEQMKTNPVLGGITHLILDEIHERDIVCDFSLALLLPVIKKRSDLKLIMMSATLNAAQFSSYYNACPSINIPGFTYPVKEYYLEDVLEMTKYTFPEPKQGKRWRKHLKRNKDEKEEVEEFVGYIEPYVRFLESWKRYSPHVLQQLRNRNSELLSIELVYELLKNICTTQGEGAVLIFLPGFFDISALHKKIVNSGQFPSHKYVIVPLHSKMATTFQKDAFARPKQGVRKIVIATNIAETSITIDDVVYVIDCGKIKMKNYRVEENLQTLKAEWVSLANARQRRGRAGRVQAGVCYHLFSKARENLLQDYQLPEILRSRLDDVILKIKIFQLGSADIFLNTFMDRPDPRAIKHSIDLLRGLNALDYEENLTPLGYHLANLPLDPQSAKMILMGALFSCVDPVFSVAASLSFKDAFLLPVNKEKEAAAKKVELSGNQKSDHMVLIEALRRWETESKRGNGRKFCWEYFLSEHILSQLQDVKRQFAESLYEMKFLKSCDFRASENNINSNNSSLIKAIVCSGLYPNVAKIKQTTRRSKIVVTEQDGRVDIHPSSVNFMERSFESPFIVYYLKQKSKNIYLFDTTMVHPLPLLFFGDRLQFVDEDGERMIRVNEVIKFRCSEDDSKIIIELKRKMNELLEYKVSHPGDVDWSKGSSEVTVLRAIKYLVTLEDSIGLDIDEDDDEDETSEI